jgi:hypothetical protein
VRDKTYRKAVAELVNLLAAIDTHQADLPALRRFKPALVGVLGILRISKAQQASLTARRRQAAQNLGDGLVASHELVARVRHLVIAAFGRHDPRLAAFGAKLPGRPSRKAKRELGETNGSPGYH